MARILQVHRVGRVIDAMLSVGGEAGGQLLESIITMKSWKHSRNSSSHLWIDYLSNLGREFWLLVKTLLDGEEQEKEKKKKKRKI